MYGGVQGTQQSHPGTQLVVHACSLAVNKAFFYKLGHGKWFGTYLLSSIVTMHVADNLSCCCYGAYNFYWWIEPLCLPLIFSDLNWNSLCMYT